MVRLGTVIAAVLLMVTVLVPVFAGSSSVYAAVDSQGQACQAIGDISSANGNCTESTGISVNKAVRLVINLLAVVAGVIAVIMLIVGGLKYITSNGDPAQITSAKRSVIYAIVGIVVVAVSQLIVKFVLSGTGKI